MRVRELLGKKKSAEVITIAPSSDVGLAARLLMQHTIGGLPVVRSDGKVVGFVSERDIVRALNRGTEGTRRLPIEEVMQRPAPTCQVDEALGEAMGRMNRERLRHLVVLDGDQIAGVLSVGDLVKHRIEQLETETGVLRDYVVAQRARS
jgi:CBS domain-containing protein